MGKKKISLAQVIQVAQGEWNILWEGMGIFLEQYGYERAEKESEADWLVTGYPIEEKKLKVKKSGKKCDIFYREKAHFYRGLTLLFQNGGKEELEGEFSFQRYDDGLFQKRCADGGYDKAICGMDGFIRNEPPLFVYGRYAGNSGLSLLGIFEREV